MEDTYIIKMNERLKLTNKIDSMYIFEKEDGKSIELKVFYTKSFVKDLKVGVKGNAEHNKDWLNKFDVVDDQPKPTPKPTPKPQTKEIKPLTPFDVKNDFILSQSILKASIKLVALDCVADKPINPNKRLGLVKHYFKDLYHFIKNEEYKELEKEFIDADEVVQ